MLKYLLSGITILLFSTLSLISQKDSAMNPNYDKTLAEKLGGDDYGMKTFFFVILTTGTNTTEEKSKVDEYFRGHMENINRLVEQKKLIIAGPFMKNDKSYRGLFIFNNVTSKDTLVSILKTDPAIKYKLLDYEIFTWYGSAALPEYLPYSDKIWKSKP